MNKLKTEPISESSAVWTLIWIQVAFALVTFLGITIYQSVISGSTNGLPVFVVGSIMVPWAFAMRIEQETPKFFNKGKSESNMLSGRFGRLCFAGSPCPNIFGYF